MIDKKVLLQRFGEDNLSSVQNLYDKYELAYNKDIPVFGNEFYPPNIWSYFENEVSTRDFKIVSFGYFEESERRMISFNNSYDIPFPLKVIKIENKSKFNNLSHRDYLGAILALGIKRTKIGDLLVKENICYFTICEEVEDYISNGINNLFKFPVEVTVLDEGSIPPSIQFKEEIILIQSLRLDSIVCKLTKISRGKAQSLIEEGKVLLNYSKTKDKSNEVKQDDRITIRGTGKFIIGGIIGNSKSGKFKISIFKYT